MLLKAEEVAQLLQVDHRRVRELARGGRIPGVVRIGRQVRFSREALDNWIATGGSPLTVESKK